MSLWKSRRSVDASGFTLHSVDYSCSDGTLQRLINRGASESDTLAVCATDSVQIFKQSRDTARACRDFCNAVATGSTPSEYEKSELKRKVVSVLDASNNLSSRIRSVRSNFNQVFDSRAMAICTYVTNLWSDPERGRDSSQRDRGASRQCRLSSPR